MPNYSPTCRSISTASDIAPSPVRTGAEALETARRRAFDVAVLDLVTPGLSGLEILRELKNDGAECQVVMLTGQGTIETAVDAMKLGAFDFLTKPAPLKQLAAVVKKAAEHGRLHKECGQLREHMRRHKPPTEIVGTSAAMREMLRLVEKAAPTDKPVLIQGESGAGKELVAKALHANSHLADKPLVVINCAALPETLLESELFGHEKGSFTGAVATKQGLFEIADGGTLFIDEIGELAGSLQAKLLRVLEDGSLRRIGSVKERRVRVRLIAATNRDLAEEVREGRFREDLFYRINVLTILVPPLRKRDGDLKLLVDHFLGEDWKVTPEAMQALSSCRWPGNVRQLQNALERAKILADDVRIQLENLPPEVAHPATAAAEILTPGADANLEAVTRHHVLEAYRRCNGNKAQTARALGVNRRSLYRLLEKHRIDG